MLDALTIKEWLLVYFLAHLTLMLIISIASIIALTRIHASLLVALRENGQAIASNEQAIQILTHESELVHYFKTIKPD